MQTHLCGFSSALKLPVAMIKFLTAENCVVSREHDLLERT